jgi:acetyl esterase
MAAPDGCLLIVDDRADVARAFRRYLSRSFAVVLVAATPVAAEALLRASPPVTHLVCDYWLGDAWPVGTELVPRWRREFPSIRRAVPLSGSHVRGIAPVPGVDAVLEKPASRRRCASCCARRPPRRRPPPRRRLRRLEKWRPASNHLNLRGRPHRGVRRVGAAVVEREPEGVGGLAFLRQPHQGLLPQPAPPKRSLAHARQRVGAVLTDGLWGLIARAGKLHPSARPEKHQVGVLANLPYRDTGMRAHHLDVYRPLAYVGPRPVVLYVHGGGFRILSKDSHWIMGLAFARRGYLVFMINYRLAPRHRFPAAIEDAAAAYAWVVRHAAEFGGDPSRLVLAGESAGANLVTALAVAATYPRHEPFARAVFDTGVVPRAVLPACGILQVTDTARFMRRRKLPAWVADRLTEVEEAYVGDGVQHRPVDLDLADPLCVLERGDAPARPLPPFFVPVGTRDPLLDDTRRLKTALDRLGAPCEARYYRGGMHAFHALVFTRLARQCWQDGFTFLGQHV